MVTPDNLEQWFWAKTPSYRLARVYARLKTWAAMDALYDLDWRLEAPRLAADPLARALLWEKLCELENNNA